MANSNDAKNTGKKLNAAAAQKLREQMANRIAELSDDELSQVAGGTDPTLAISLAVSAITTLAIPLTGPSSPNAVSPSQVPSTAG